MRQGVYQKERKDIREQLQAKKVESHIGEAPRAEVRENTQVKETRQFSRSQQLSRSMKD